MTVQYRARSANAQTSLEKCGGDSFSEEFPNVSLTLIRGRIERDRLEVDVFSIPVASSDLDRARSARRIAMAWIRNFTADFSFADE